MKRLHINGHDGTHVDAPFHSEEKGKTIEDYQIRDFIGKCVVYGEGGDVNEKQGVIFVKENIDMVLAKVIVKNKPGFVGLSCEFEFSEDVEKFLLGKGVLLFERLANTDKLPKDKKFMFYGVPLKIKDGDGSPVRAYAVV